MTGLEAKLMNVRHRGEGGWVGRCWDPGAQTWAGRRAVRALGLVGWAEACR